MPRIAIVIGGAVVALLLLAVGGRLFATRLMNQRAMAAQALGTATPAAAKLPFSRVAVASGDRTLIGWWVRARGDSGKAAPAVLFLHSNGSTISDYVPLQRFLYGQGVSSFVFDYTGVGASGGSASLSNAVEDAGNAAKVFADSARGARTVALGSGLGATVLLQAIDSVGPRVKGIVLEGVDASARDAAVRAGRLPKFLAPLVADIADNLTVARRVTVPTLVVHGKGDTRSPREDANMIMAEIPGKTSLLLHWRKGHSALLSSSKVCDWQPVLDFVKAGTLPAAKIDSTDACAAAQAKATAAAAAAAAQAAQQTKGRTRSTPTKAAPTKRP